MTPPDGPLEALLVHDQALRGLARGLLVDAHAAEDLAQDTWLAALSRGADPETPRAWLASVARNLAAKLRRGEERRARRERDSARNEREPSAEEILGREAARARVVAAVLALEEPYRATVLLRHFEDQPPRAIARRHGVPVETVRTRLKRAHELLRARLERERCALGVWLLPLARGPRGSTVLSPLVTAVLMSTQVKVAVSVAAAALVVLLVVRTQRPPELAREPGPAAAAPAALSSPPGAPALAVVAPAERVAVSTAASEAPPPPQQLVGEPRGALRVTVTRADGSPAPGIHARVETDWSSGNPSWRARAAVTDDQGVFTLSDLAPGAALVQLDRASGGIVQIVASEETEAALTLEPGFDVAGSVLDPLGIPVGDAEVWLSYPHTSEGGLVVARTGTDGRFELQGCTGGALNARAARFAPSLLLPLRAHPGSRIELELVLMGPGGELAGRVLDADGELVPGAYVLVEPLGFKRQVRAVPVGGTREVAGQSAPAQDVRTDETGTFRVAGLEPGLRELAVQAPGHALWRGEVEVFALGSSTLDVRLQRGVTVVGRVLDAQGSSVRAEITAEPDEDLLDPFWAGTTADAEGRFRLTDLGPEEFVIQAETRHGRARATLRGAPGEVIEWNPVLGRAGVIRGQLVDERGAGVADHFVYVEDEGPFDPEHCGQAWGGRTDAEGRFAIEGPGAHAHRVEAHAMGVMLFPLALATGVHPDREPLRLQIAPASRPSVFLAGLVVDATGAPVANAQVQARRPGSRRVAQVLSDAEGGFELGPFPPGEWTVEVRAPSGAPELPPTTLGPRTLAAGETWDCGELTLALPLR